MPKKGVIELSKLYERIVDLCNKEGINLTEMCRRSGVPRGNLTDLYKGRQDGLSLKNMMKIANYFNVSVEYLETGEIEKAPVHKDEDLTEEQKQLIKLFESAPSAYQSAALALLRQAEAESTTQDD